MKIAITGGTGEIGGLYLRHAAKNNELHVLTRDVSKVNNIPEKRKITKFCSTRRESYDNTVISKFTQADALVHFAALLNQPTHSINAFFATNALLTGLLVINASRQKNMPKFIYISSAMVYTLQNDDTLAKMKDEFITFCKKVFSDKIDTAITLQDIAMQFLAQQQDFPFDKFNAYALTKYLGEAIVLSYPNTCVLRITNAYGPGFDNMRLIPKLITNRLQGNTVTYINENRDYIYNEDIYTVIDHILNDNISGTIDAKSEEIIATNTLQKIIEELTPTAYGQILQIPRRGKETKYESIPKADKTLKEILPRFTSFHNGIRKTIQYHKKLCYHQMEHKRAIQEFIFADEQFVQTLHGSSAAYLFVLQKNGVKKVRKVALREGVEGNGIAKVKSEIRYYEHIKRYNKKLAKMYPSLIDSYLAQDYTYETLAYINGPNVYEELSIGKESFPIYKKSVATFLNKLSSSMIQTCKLSNSSEQELNTYYIERALYRLQPITSFIPVTETLYINGQMYKSPQIILQDLLENKHLREYILPRVKTFCFHGDLTFLNTVYTKKTKEIRLIDPRGYIGDWDPLYDYGKLKFTLDGFGEIIQGEKSFITKKKGEYFIYYDQIPYAVNEMNRIFFDLLDEDTLFTKTIIPLEPYWRYRILFAAASHFLADIPFRLYIDNTHITALESYIIGTFYLNNIYNMLKKIS